MSEHCCKRLRTWKRHILLVVWVLLMTARPTVDGYFLGDTKAVLNGCDDHWTLQDKASFLLLYKMTVCVNIRVVVPGTWIAFTYSSIHGLMPELGLEGDDAALYAWLLRVKHRFPLKLSLQDWHQVCLRRDVVGSSFSLEVDNHVVGHRIVIAQAIPPYGSLWLGCGQRDHPLGHGPGQVELYLFRVWSDLEQHSSCEDGSVIGWDSEFWGVTSANARQRDPSLSCVHRRLPRRARRYRREPVVPEATTTPNPVRTTPSDPEPHTEEPTGHNSLTCRIDQLCSSNNTYFWIPMNVTALGEFHTVNDIRAFMSSVFNCSKKGAVPADIRSDFDIFCQYINNLQVEQVSCVMNQNMRETQCGVVLQLSPTVSACKVRQAGLSALQQAPDEQIRATIIGEVQRVGQNLCDDVAPSSGGFVTCSSTLSLEKMCQSNMNTTQTCTLLEPGSVPVQPVTTDSCSSEETLFCDCTPFCNNQNQFYAQRLNITNASIDTKFLQNLLKNQVILACGRKPKLECIKALDVLKNQLIKRTYLDCQKTNQRSYSCMMILEMTKPLTDCSAVTVLQTLMNNTEGVTAEGPLTHMVVCGDPAPRADILLTSNLTWFSSNLLTSDVCKASQTRLKCATNETLAVLLSDTCPPKPTEQTSTPLPTKTSTTPSTITSTTQTKSNTDEGTTPISEINNATTASAATTQPTTPTEETTAATNHVTVYNMTTVTRTDFTSLNGTTVNRTTRVTPDPSTNNPTTINSVATDETHTNTTKQTVGDLTTTENSLSPTTEDSVTTATPATHTASTGITRQNTAQSVSETVNNPTTQHTTAHPNSVTTADVFTPFSNHSTVNNVTSVSTFITTESENSVDRPTTTEALTRSLNDTTTLPVHNKTTASSQTSTPTATAPPAVHTSSTTPESDSTTLEDTTLTLHHTTTTTTTETTPETTPPTQSQTTINDTTTPTTFTPTQSKHNPNTSDTSSTTANSSVDKVTTVNAAEETTTSNLINNATTANALLPSHTHTTTTSPYYTTTTANTVHHTTIVNTTEGTISEINNATTPSATSTMALHLNSTSNHVTTVETIAPQHTTPTEEATTATNHVTVYNMTTVTRNQTSSRIFSSLNGTTVNQTSTASPDPLTNNTITNSVATDETHTNTTKQTVVDLTTTENSLSQTTADSVTTATPATHTASTGITRQNTAQSVSETVNNPTTQHTTAHPNSVTTADVFTPFSNHSTVNNVTSVSTFITTESDNSVDRPTTTEALTRSLNDSTTLPVYNKTTESLQTSTPTATAPPAVHTSSTTPESDNDTTVTLHHTTTTTETTTETTPPTQSQTTINDETTPTTFTPTQSEDNPNTSDMSSTTESSKRSLNDTTTLSAYIASPNPTTEYNVTTAETQSPLLSVTTGSSTSTATPTDSERSVTANYTAVSPKYTVNTETAVSSGTLNNTVVNTTTAAPIPSVSEEHDATTAGQETTKMTKEEIQTIYSTVTASPNNTATLPYNYTTRVTTTAQNTAAQDSSNTTTPFEHTTASLPINNVTQNTSPDNMTTSSTISLLTEVSKATSGAIVSPQPTVTPTNTTPINTLDPQPTPGETTTTKSEVPVASRTTSQTSTANSSTATVKPGTGFISTTTEETTRTQKELEDKANNLLSQTENVSKLNSSQVSKLVEQLEGLLDGPTVSQALGQKAINIISNLMEGDSQALAASANRLIRFVDELGFKLVVSGENEILSSTSLVLAVRTVDETNFPSSAVEIFNPDDVKLNATRRSRSLDAPMGSVFLPSSLTEDLSPDEQLQASRVQFTFYTKSTLFQDATLKEQTRVSPVLGSSVANLSISNLRESIQVTIRNINPIKSNHSASCVFWDFTQNDGGGGWNNAGCSVVNATPEDTTCSCNHLTSFAVLLDLSREGLSDRRQAQILTFITYIGCGVSVIFLAVTLLTYLSFEKLLRDIPAKILVQLCISLLLLNLVFLMDGWLALYSVNGLCISTAFFLHYFLLTSFTWAGLEALHMYLSIVRVFTPYLSQYMLKFSLMGWGIPLIVVIITIAVDKNNYGQVTYGRYTDGTTDDFCWLRNNIAFYIGVVAYFLLIFALCLIVFIVVMVQLARIKKQNPQNQSPNRGVMTDLRSISGLIILLGLTWGFALFAWGPLYLPFVYLFSIFNSLQGLFVFVFHCAVKENVQRQWRTYLCCGDLRLAENSDWSRTATHNNRNMSFAIMSSSAAHLTSSSASVISDTISSASVFADSGISDGSHSDVVMNEIHRRNMSLH